MRIVASLLGMTGAGIALLLLGGAAIWRLARDGGPYRAGPWPGLSPKGAAVLLACAALLGGGQLELGNPRSALPDLPLLGVLALLPLAVAMRTVRAPGAASAVCGAYLLPRTLLSLVDPSVEPPPLLLVPALAFDVSAWLRTSDLVNLSYVVPRRGPNWRKRDRRPRQVNRWRGAFAGAIFGSVLSAVEPPFAVLLGADSQAWSGAQFLQAAGLSVVACSLVGFVVAVSGRDTAS